MPARAGCRLETDALGLLGFNDQEVGGLKYRVARHFLQAGSFQTRERATKANQGAASGSEAEATNAKR